MNQLQIGYKILLIFKLFFPKNYKGKSIRISANNFMIEANCLASILSYPGYFFGKL